MAAQDEPTIGMPGESAVSSELGAPGAPDPAPGAAIQRRLEARGAPSPRVIAVQGAGSVAGRVARLAQGRLPLLDALQRRWGASAAWPGMSELSLVTPLADAYGAPAGQEVAAPAANPAETDAPATRRVSG